MAAAFAGARGDSHPFPHWVVDRVLPEGMAETLRRLPFLTQELQGLSGKRELHNDQRHYFDAANNARFAVCAAMADAFQSPKVVGAIQRTTGARLCGSFVRLEYAHDTDGFWLEPHTDLGVKLFTMLIYLPESVDQSDLGTDLYSDARTWAKRPPFGDNTAVTFIPGGDTWHGFSRRPIRGARRSVIMNYVSDDWQAREQLAYPATPVRA